jgi:hypothetical protein
MKKGLRLVASVLVMAALASVTVSCSEDDDLGLVGHWVFLGDANCIFTMNGVRYDAVEEGLLDRSNFNSLRGTSFKFEKDGTAYIGMNGQTSSPCKYTVSGNKLTIKDGSFSWPMKYRLTGGNLELIWDEITMAIAGIDDSSLTDLGIDDYEMILTFVRAD